MYRHRFFSYTRNAKIKKLHCYHGGCNAHRWNFYKKSERPQMENAMRPRLKKKSLHQAQYRSSHSMRVPRVLDCKCRICLELLKDIFIGRFVRIEILWCRHAFGYPRGLLFCQMLMKAFLVFQSIVKNAFVGFINFTSTDFASRTLRAHASDSKGIWMLIFSYGGCGWGILWRHF